jgi:hypothetical protein
MFAYVTDGTTAAKLLPMPPPATPTAATARRSPKLGYALAATAATLWALIELKSELAPAYGAGAWATARARRATARARRPPAPVE